MEKNQAELTEMEKDIYGIERKYSLYYKEKKKYNTLYYVFSVETFLFIKYVKNTRDFSHGMN